MPNTIELTLAKILAVLVLALGLLAYGLWEHSMVAQRDAVIAQWKDNSAQAQANFVQAARAQEQKWAQQVDEIEESYETQLQADDARAKSDAAARGVLERQIAAYAAGRSAGLPAAPQAGPQVDDRAEVLGRLLGECVDLLGQGADDARRAAAQIRALILADGSAP